MNSENLKSMLQQGQDNLLLRFGLGQALINEKKYAEAADHLQKALEFDPQHSSSWKLLGKAFVELKENQHAMDTYEQGIKVAERSGDLQAAKEMQVFLKRLKKQSV